MCKCLSHQILYFLKSITKHICSRNTLEFTDSNQQRTGNGFVHKTTDMVPSLQIELMQKDGKSSK
jgi:hypothetical protein